MKNEEIKIQEIKTDQLEMYKNFLQIGLINDEESFRISPNDDLKTPFPTNETNDSFTIGAFLNENLAGIVSFSRDGNDREKLRHKGILFRMYVSSEYRGRGIAKILIENVIERAKLLDNMEQINLTVVTNNINAKNIYTKFGFETFSSERNAFKWKEKYFDEDAMVLFLNK
jgi:ribosomal protein S18 acetylase RimI-like enzyme